MKAPNKASRASSQAREVSAVPQRGLLEDPRHDDHFRCIQGVSVDSNFSHNPVSPGRSCLMVAQRYPLAKDAPGATS